MAPGKKSKINSSLNESTEELIKTFVAKRSDLILVLSNRDKIIYCTDAAARILKKKKNQLINSKFPYPLSAEIITLSKSKPGIVYRINTVSVVLRKKKLKFLFLNKVAQKNKSKNTQKINYESELLHPQEMLQLVLDNIPQRVFWKDRNYIYLGCNQAFAKDAYLNKPSEIIGKSDFELSWKDTAALYRQNDEEVMESDIPKINFEEPQSTPEGNQLCLRTSKIPLHDRDGNVIGILGTYEDITERKRMEETLSVNRRLLNAIITNLPDQIYVKDLEGRFLLCNKAVVHNAGLIKPEFQKEEDLIGKSDFDIFPYDDAVQYRSYEKAIMDSGEQIFNLEETYMGKTGLTTKVLMKDDSGKVIGLIGMNKDITERKKVEETLKNEHILLRTIIDNLPDAIYTKDIECRKTLGNRADLENMGCKNETEVIGKTDFDFFPEKTASVFYQDDQLVMKSGKPFLNRDESFVDKNGQVHWLLTSKLPLRNVDGRIVGIVGIGHDITKRKKTELLNEALFKISETSYTASDMHALYKNIHEVIKTLMPANNFYIAQYDDKADLLSFPYFIDERDSSPIPRKPGNRLTEYVLRNGEAILVDAMKALELKQSGKVVLSKSPIPIWLGVPLKIEGKVIGVIVLCDYENENVYSEDEMQLLIFVSNQVAQVIERKKNSEAIQTYIEELRLLNQTKDKFFSIIAHDLKNPFITILGFCDLLLSDFTELSVDEMLFFIQEMKNSANLNHNLLQNLLLWSRSQTGRLEFSPRKLELLDIINENFLLLNKTSEKKQIRLHHEIPFALHVTADEDMLNTVLRNLLTNAIKFSNKGSIISVKAVANDNFVEICVADSGIGMDQKKIDNLFRLDAAHSTAGTENELGTGLGLILCKEFIEKNGGKIWVESEIGKGSKFNFSLLS
jgi:PAS domain S-box-containing protein